MKLSRDSMTRVTKLPLVSWDNQTDEIKQAIILKCQTLLKQLPEVTSIEGVKNLSGAKYVLETALLKTLENLGATVDQTQLDDLLVHSFLTEEAPAPAKNVAPTIDDIL